MKDKYDLVRLRNIRSELAQYINSNMDILTDTPEISGVVCAAFLSIDNLCHSIMLETDIVYRDIINKA